MDMNAVVRMVDNPKDSCPGSVFGNKLIPIGHQIERRLFRGKRIKNIIYREDTTRNIWYKSSNCNGGVVAMGFSLSRMTNHPNAVSMNLYSKYFIDKIDPIWLTRNDFVLI